MHTQRVFLLSCIGICICASRLLPQSTPTPVESLRVIQHNAFDVGERLVFDVKYSFIVAGEAMFRVSELIEYNGRQCYRVEFTVQSTPTFSWIYKVDDWYETIIDKKGIFPWRFKQRLREGKYRNDFEARFDQLNHVAYTEKGQYAIPPYVYDAVSAFYYVRTLDFSKSKPGERLTLYNFYKDSTYTLAVKFLGFQQISIAAGTFNTVVIEPLMREGGLFKSEGRIIIWLTNDEKKIPVKVSTKVIVGSIDAELREYSGISSPITAKVE